MPDIASMKQAIASTGELLDRQNDLDSVLQALGALNEVYHRVTSDVYQHRVDIERHLHYLMLAYDRYLG